MKRNINEIESVYKEVKIVNKSKEKLSQIAKPIGFRGRITARFMPIGHRAYTRT